MCCRVYAKIICILIHINFGLLSCLAHNCDFVGRILFCGIWLNILWKNAQLRAYGPLILEFRLRILDLKTREVGIWIRSACVRVYWVIWVGTNGYICLIG